MGLILVECELEFNQAGSQSWVFCGRIVLNAVISAVF